ncbi:hypothetical protein QJ857_gp0963 [Tupanvirus soda lake]|uniref:NHL repeat-containing protein n=2 Tax=Tupanvirus TaxID=2094720 RepID=A0A6N1P234_9VIRU|nr:hypothetical protein QJ857_gp0963 [Tupanvirus soda lake]QKU35091.1 hypothetical protein [Tupanvirus soda lake]
MSNCKHKHKGKNKKNSTCTSDVSIESESLTQYFGCNKIPKCLPTPCVKPKEKCPLKSFCDPGLKNTCAAVPMIDPCAPGKAVTTWKVNYLVSNVPGEAAHYDEDLVQPRGIVIYQNQLWMSNTMSDKITNYDLFGNKLLPSIQVRWNRFSTSFPSGLAINCGGGFGFSNGIGGPTKPAVLATGTKTGDVAVYNPAIDQTRTFVIINNKMADEVAQYTGIAIVNNVMYLADFFQGHIDVFGADTIRIGKQGRTFVDNYAVDPIPLSYGPHNIVYICPYLYVMYAERQPGSTVHHSIGPGKGYISVFTLDGAFVRRFHSGGVLNTPWSIIPAPCECGIPPNSFLVNNIGDGRINLFDCEGNFLGPLLGQSGIPIVIPGLQSLVPNYTIFNEIFFTASEDIESRGLLGSIVRDQVIYL